MRLNMKKKSKDKLPQLSEKMFMSRVVAGARALGFLVYHTYDSRRSAKGFPDLVMCHPKTGELLFIELKTDTGKVSAEQQIWLDALTNCKYWQGSKALMSCNFHPMVLRPARWDDFWEMLKGLAK